MTDKTDIFKSINHNDGMTAPDGYFEQFNSQMKEMISRMPASVAPHTERSLWMKIRPYVYLAAMFAGIFCMMQIFSLTSDSGNSIRLERFPTLTATLENSSPDPDIIEISQHDMIEHLLDEGYDADDLFSDDSLFVMSDDGLSFDALQQDTVQL